MKNKLSATIFTILILVFLFPQSSLAIELEKCKDCHGYVKPLVDVVKGCACHNQEDHQLLPNTRDQERVHRIHSTASRLTQERCTVCHKRKPYDCTNCHNTHEITRNLNKNNTRLNVTLNISRGLDVSDCIGCHGGLPVPLGHTNFRGVLSKSKHQWMNCRTCHVNTYVAGKGNNFGLHFRDLLTVPIDNSIDLCKICHLPQYDKLKNDEHGNSDEKCIDCHNPHTTDFSGSKISVDEEKINISGQVSSATDWITTNVPIVRNPIALYVIIIIVLATVAEYMLSKDEEGKKTAYNTIKVHDNEETLKTLEIKSKNQNIDIINEILETNGVNVLGMTMTKEEEYGDINTYKYVIFANIIEPIDESELISKITTVENVKSATFTEKYEL